MYYSRARWRVSDLFDQRTWFTQSGAFSNALSYSPLRDNLLYLLDWENSLFSQ
ncbi:hypothetical protein G3Z73_003530 [Escherichia coli]|nr:hypothetical protein [Escherichia coli]